jgi:hypothetical protein
MAASRFRLDAAEVTWGTSVSRTFDITIEPDASHASQSPVGAGRSGNRRPRSAKRTEQRITMVHIPTRLEVHGIFSGFYDRKELSAMHSTLLGQLFSLLEQRLARHLRVPGR